MVGLRVEELRRRLLEERERVGHRRWLHERRHACWREAELGRRGNRERATHDVGQHLEEFLP